MDEHERLIKHLKKFLAFCDSNGHSLGHVDDDVLTRADNELIGAYIVHLYEEKMGEGG